MSAQKTLLILMTDAKAILPVDQFLSNRDWDIYMTANLKDALEYLVLKKPAFFLVSVEHTSVKTQSLMSMVMQTYPTVVIPFAEHSTLAAFKSLTEINSPYRIFPPITGPAVERAANRFAKDLTYKKAQEQAIARAQERANRNGIGVAPVLVEPEQNLAPSGVLLKGLHQSFAELTPEKPVQQRLGLVTNTACMLIDSPRFCGYLLVAIAGRTRVDESFISTVKHRLLRYLSQSGEVIRDGESFPISLKEVHFEAWALEYAEFLKKTVHEGKEVAMAFFPVEEIRPVVGRTQHKDMRSVRVDDIKADSRVAFNVYLYLPANQRFLLYTGAGGVFYGKQKEKLKEKGVSELFIQEKDVTSFVQYRVQARFDDLVQDFDRDSAKVAS